MLNSFKEKQGSYIHHHYFSCELTKDVAGIPIGSYRHPIVNFRDVLNTFTELPKNSFRDLVEVK